MQSPAEKASATWGRREGETTLGENSIELVCDLTTVHVKIIRLDWLVSSAEGPRSVNMDGTQQL